jgi:branched-chain amino acid transport system ATP-binding protein
MREILTVNHLSAAYGKADVLSDVSIAIESGKITCLLGANGAGKSTLIKVLLGLLKPHTGEIFFAGENITGLPPHEIISRGIACIPEGRRIFPKMTVEENLYMGAYQEPSSAKIRKKMAEVYALFPRLEERRAQLAGTMSGGEQAMVSIGRGLMHSPRLLIIDEPSLGLSPALVSNNFRIIRQICEAGTSIFLVEQNVRQTLAISGYGYVLSQGRIVARGEARLLRDDEAVKEAYFG